MPTWHQPGHLVSAARGAYIRYMQLPATALLAQLHSTRVPQSKCVFAGSGQRRLVVVMFIGGVTFAEVAALRWLSRRSDISADFLVCTTKLISGSSLLSSCMNESVLASMAQAGVV
jgi:Sec1 family